MKSPIARSIVWVLALLVSAVSVWASWHLAELHYRLDRPGESLLGDVCTAFATSSCQKVAQSRWAYLPPLPVISDEVEKPENAAESTSKPADEEAGESAVDRMAAAEKKAKEAKAEREKWWRVPVSQLGLAYFTVAFWWLLLTGPAPATRRWTHQTFDAIALIGVAASAFFEIIMWTQLEYWCPLCVGTHIASALLAIFVLLLWPRLPVVDQAIQDRLDSTRARVHSSTPERAQDHANSLTPEHAQDRVNLLTPENQPGGATPSVPTSPGAFGASDASGGLFGPGASSPRAWGETINAIWPTTRVMATTLIVVVLSLLLEHQYFAKLSYRGQAATATAYQGYFRKKWEKYERNYLQNYIAWASSPRVEIPLEGRPMRGSANAPRTLVIFSDFECPHCARFEEFYRTKVEPLARQARDGGFKIYYKHWPLCKDCNSVMEGDTKHPLACRAAYAAEAARLLGGDDAFWKMHDLLYQKQGQWLKTKDFLPYAAELGLDRDKFAAAMNSTEAISRVRADVADGDALGSELQNPAKQADIKVDSTPTVFVDGRRLDSAGNPRTWSMILGNRDAFAPMFKILQQSALPSAPRPTATRSTAVPLGPRLPAGRPGR